MLLNEYLKRYKAYIDASTHLNEYLENFNVLINSVYEHLTQSVTVYPKFSVFRLMIITWNREVLHKLEQDQLSGKIANLFDEILNQEAGQIDESSFNPCHDYELNGDCQNDVSINSISTNYSHNVNSLTSSINSSVIINVVPCNVDGPNLNSTKLGEKQSGLKEMTKLFEQ